jgi:signal peptidase II
VTGITGLIIVIDQLSKKWAMSSLLEGYDRPLMDHLLTFRLRFNSGGTLGVLPSQTVLWLAVQAAALVVIPAIPLLLQRPGLPMRGWIGIAGLMGAGASNLVDQVRLATAIDLIHVPYLTFNLADVAGVIGAITVVLAVPPEAKIRRFWSAHRKLGRADNPNA